MAEKSSLCLTTDASFAPDYRPPAASPIASPTKTMPHHLVRVPCPSSPHRTNPTKKSIPIGRLPAQRQGRSLPVTDAAFFAIIPPEPPWPSSPSEGPGHGTAEPGRNDAVLFFRGQWWRTITSLPARRCRSPVSNSPALSCARRLRPRRGAGLLPCLAGVVGNTMATSCRRRLPSARRSTMVFGISASPAPYALGRLATEPERVVGRLIRLCSLAAHPAGVAIFAFSALRRAPTCLATPVALPPASSRRPATVAEMPMPRDHCTLPAAVAAVVVFASARPLMHG